MLEMIEDYAFPQRLVLAVNLRSIFMDTTFVSGVCKILSHFQNERDSERKTFLSFFLASRTVRGIYYTLDSWLFSQLMESSKNFIFEHYGALLQILKYWHLDV